MADVITRFKLETTQYDSKLRDVSKGLADLTNRLSMTGKDFDRFAKNHVQTAASLGKVASGATNLKDKLKDLVGAYNTAARAYNSLTKEQQAGDFGKAMSASLQKLKQDITQTKNELYNIGEQSKGTGGIMDMLAQKMTVNVDAAKLFELGLKALNTVLGTLKDAFFNNEEQLDEWGRIVESSHSLYNGFLNALNTGDISGYLNNMGSIVQAARGAYDAMDELATYNAFNQRNIQRARTGLTESIVDFREGTGSKEDVKAAGEALKKELRDRQKKEYEAYYKNIGILALTRGVDKEGLTAVLEGTYDEYKKKKGIEQTGRSQRYVPGLPGMPGRYEEVSFSQGKLEKMAEALRNLNDTELQSIQALGAQADRTGDEIAQVDKQLTRVLNGRQSGSGSGSNVSTNVKDTVFPKGSLNDLNQQLKSLREKQNNATSPEAWKEYEAQIKIVTNSIKELKGELPEPGSITDLDNQIKELRDAQSNVTNVTEWQKFQDKIDAVKNRVKELKGELSNIEAGNMVSLGKIKGLSITDMVPVTTDSDIIKRGDQRIKDFKISGGEDLAKQGEQAQKAWNLAAQAVSSVGDAFKSIEDPGAKAMGTVLQAISSIALGFAMASSNANTAGTGWGWLAWLAAGTAAMATTISTIHSLTGFANGGIVDGRNGGFVGGTNFSGDNIGNVRLNAGELVLNQAQAGVIANALQDRDFAFGASLQPYVDGEKIFLGMNNTSKRMGRGEIVTTSTLQRLGLI